MWKLPALNLIGKSYTKRVYTRGQIAEAPLRIRTGKQVNIIKGERNRGRSKGRGKRS